MGGTDSALLYPFLAALPLVPIVGLSSLRQGALVGLRHVIAGQLPGQFIQPGILALALLIGYLVLGPGFLTPLEAIALNILAAVIVFFIGTVWLLRKLPSGIARSEPIYRTRQWLAMSLPFLVLAGVYVINERLDVVMLGLLRSSADAGVYQVCLSAGALATLGYTAASVTTAPEIARLWEQKDRAALQKAVTGAARFGLATAVPLVLLFATSGGFLLAALFGEQFRSGWLTLILVSLGYLVSAFFGAVSVILNMTGHTWLALRGVAVGVITDLVLNLILIPPLGMVGAGIAALVSYLIWNLMLFGYVAREVGVYSWAFGGRRNDRTDE